MWEIMVTRRYTAYENNINLTYLEVKMISDVSFYESWES